MTQLSIEQELLPIDIRNPNWYPSLSEEDKKIFGKKMWVTQRLACSVQNTSKDVEAHYIVMINDFSNVHFSELKKHPELQYRLMMIAGIGKSLEHYWLRPMSKSAVDNGINPKLFKFYLELYPHLNDVEVNLALTAIGKDRLIELLEDAGLDKKKIKEYTK